MMKWLLFLLLLAGCGFADSNEADTSSSLPLIQSMERDPLLLSFVRTSQKEDAVELHFLAEHTNGEALTPDDYTFREPEFISDDQGTSHEVLEMAQYEEEFLGDTLSENTIGITITADAAAAGMENDRYSVPFHIKADLYRGGYPFSVSEDTPSDLGIGDLQLADIIIDDSTLSFRMQDDHPEARDKRMHYSFMQRIDGEHVYPVFRNVEEEGDKLFVTLDFAQELPDPAAFRIQRTNAGLPEWQFSLVVPMEND